MAKFTPVFVRRSDGKLAISKSAHSSEDNAPLPEQLDTKPNAQGVCDYYRECQPGEAKEIDWRRKLGGMLVREIAPTQFKAPDKNFILAALPENYRLYEHVRHKASESSEPAQKQVKNHAAGSNERQDAYLYGHPQGRKKRYRSPAEFFPHLLWLSTDEKGDANNCSCKFCTPEEIDIDEKPKASSKEPKEAHGPKDVQIKRSAQENNPSASALSLTPMFVNENSSAARSSLSEEQILDAQYNRFLYRPGELIWFQRDQASWGLGVITSRVGHQTSSHLNQYQIQPLSHPLSHPPPTTCTQTQLRAWLAWSPPPCLNPNLTTPAGTDTKPFTYFDVDWIAYCNGAYGAKNAEIDGSILIAKYVETTFTLFDKIQTQNGSQPGGPSLTTFYNGLYFGSEKLWVGDPLRLRNNANPNDVAVLLAIAEQSNSHDASQSKVLLTVDIYTTSKEPDPSSSSREHLPVRLEQNLQFRNAMAMRAPDKSKHIPHYWNRKAQNTQLVLSDIKGRWYESSVLLPILVPDVYRSDQQRGELSDITTWMNSQGDCNKPPQAATGVYKVADVKLPKREQAFGKAVPPSFHISDGLDGRGEKTQEAGRPNSQPSQSYNYGSPNQSQPLQQAQSLGVGQAPSQISPSSQLQPSTLSESQSAQTSTESNWPSSGVGGNVSNKSEGVGEEMSWRKTSGQG